MIRIALALALMTATADAKTITLGERPGGYIKLHLDVAKRWLRQGVSLRVNGDQWSAAAIQLRYFRKNGGRVCATRRVMYYDHAGAGWRKYDPRLPKCR